VAKGPEGYEFPLMRDGDRGSREGAGSDRVLEDAESGRKALVLIFEGGDWDGMGRVESQRIDPICVIAKSPGSGKAKGRWRIWHLRVARFVEATQRVVYSRSIQSINLEKGPGELSQARGMAVPVLAAASDVAARLLRAWQSGLF
jgi:hypothetical protein